MKHKLSEDRMLYVSAWISAVVFTLFSIALIGALASGVKDEELLVASLYSGGCFVALIATLLLFFHSIRWSLLVFVGAMVAAVGGYAFEPDFQSDEGYVAALILIGAPTLIGFLVATGYVKASKRRSGQARIPEASLRD